MLSPKQNSKPNLKPSRRLSFWLNAWVVSSVILNINPYSLSCVEWFNLNHARWIKENPSRTELKKSQYNNDKREWMSNYVRSTSGGHCCSFKRISLRLGVFSVMHICIVYTFYSFEISQKLFSSRLHAKTIHEPLKLVQSGMPPDVLLSSALIFNFRVKFLWTHELALITLNFIGSVLSVATRL